MFSIVDGERRLLDKRENSDGLDDDDDTDALRLLVVVVGVEVVSMGGSRLRTK